MHNYAHTLAYFVMLSCYSAVFKYFYQVSATTLITLWYKK